MEFEEPNDVPKFTSWFKSSRQIEVRASFEKPTEPDRITSKRQGHFTTTAMFDHLAIAQKGVIASTASGKTIVVINGVRNALLTFGRSAIDRPATRLK